MKKPILLSCMLVAALAASAQGNNTRMGGEDGDYQSLAERVAKIEKKNDMFNVYFNYAASAQLPTASNSASCIASSAINVNE